jgi:hypothetical protein
VVPKEGLIWCCPRVALARHDYTPRILVSGTAYIRPEKAIELLRTGTRGVGGTSYPPDLLACMLVGEWLDGELEGGGFEKVVLILPRDVRELGHYLIGLGIQMISSGLIQHDADVQHLQGVLSQMVDMAGLLGEADLCWARVPPRGARGLMGPFKVIRAVLWAHRMGLLSVSLPPPTIRWLLSLQSFGASSLSWILHHRLAVGHLILDDLPQWGPALRSLGIRCVVTLGAMRGALAGYERAVRGLGLLHYNLPLNQDSLPQLDYHAVISVSTSRLVADSGPVLLISAQEGAEPAAVVAMAYLITVKGLEVRRAIALINCCRPGAIGAPMVGRILASYEASSRDEPDHEIVKRSESTPPPPPSNPKKKPVFSPAPLPPTTSSKIMITLSCQVRMRSWLRNRCPLIAITSLKNRGFLPGTGRQPGAGKGDTQLLSPH